MTTVCERSVEVMFDLAEGLRPDGDVEAARQHLEHCERCRQRLADSLLVVVHLRRMADEAAHAEPPTDAWERLQRRIASTKTDPAARTHRQFARHRIQEVSGIVAAALVVALAGPFAVGTLASGIAAPTVAGSTQPAAPTATAADGRLPVSLTRSDDGGQVAPDLLSTFLPHGSVPDAIPPDANGLSATVPSDGPTQSAPAPTCSTTADASERPACAAVVDPVGPGPGAAPDATITIDPGAPTVSSASAGPAPTTGSAVLPQKLPDRR